MFPLKHCLCVCIFWWFGSSPCAPALQLQLCHSHLVKEEYYIAPPSGCKRHNGTYIKTCTAEVFLPTNDFLHLSITTCEVFKTVSSTPFISLEPKPTPIARPPVRFPPSKPAPSGSVPAKLNAAAVYLNKTAPHGPVIIHRPSSTSGPLLTKRRLTTPLLHEQPPYIIIYVNNL